MQTALYAILLLFLASEATGFVVGNHKSDGEASEINERLLMPMQPIYLGNEWKDVLSGTDSKPVEPPNKRAFPLIPVLGGMAVCYFFKCGKKRHLSDENVETLAETLALKSSADFRSLYKEKVVKAALYKVDSSVLGKVVADEQELLDGVLVTLTNGRRLMITRGPELWGDEKSAVLEVEDLTDNWQFVESKNVQFSVVADYVSASDSSSNTKEAAERMMALD